MRLAELVPAVTTVGGAEEPRWERLNELHKPTNPREYFRLSMAHPGEQERAIMRSSDRVLGAISLTRGTRHALACHHSLTPAQRSAISR
jgi:hypothetical protein